MDAWKKVLILIFIGIFILGYLTVNFPVLDNITSIMLTSLSFLCVGGIGMVIIKEMRN